MKKTTTLSAKIAEFKKNHPRYRVGKDQGLLVDQRELDISDPSFVNFVPFTELSEEQLDRIVDEQLRCITDTENYEYSTGDYNGRQICQGIVNYENEERYAHYSRGISKIERYREYELIREGKSNRDNRYSDWG